MTEPEKAIAKLKKLDVFARASGAKIDVAALYAENMANGLEGKVSQELGVHAVGDSFMNELGKSYRGETQICNSCIRLNTIAHRPFKCPSLTDDGACQVSCSYVMPDCISWPWQQIDSETNVRIGRFANVLMWFRFMNAMRAGEDIADGKWRHDLLADFDVICRIACAAVETKIEKEIAELENAEDPSPSPPPSTGSFRKSDRKMLFKVYKRVVLEEAPDDAQRAGDIRQRQILHGLRLYKPSSMHKKGVSFREAAKRTISDQKFKGKGGKLISGAYTLNEIDTLAQAIRRAYNAEEADSAT